MLLEVCANSIQSAINAQLGGASRIELCAALELGGLTPSAATIQQVRQQLSIEVFVLIRPRAGDFCYHKTDFECMKQNILWAKKMGVDGIVTGILHPDVSIDVPRNKTLLQLAHPLPVTFHRAFDYIPIEKQIPALNQLIQLGFKRLLTSGGSHSAAAGKQQIKQLIQHAKKRIQIMPGAGINSQNILEIINYTNAKEIHLSGKKTIVSKIKIANPKNNSAQLNASNAIPEFNYSETSVEEIKKIIARLKNKTNNLL